jgi:hypothetical protein
MRIGKHRPSATLIIALLALFVALGGVGVAADGGNLVLGQPNTAASMTSLSAPVTGGKTFQLTNNDATDPASTALALHVPSGHAPFTVNSSGKVANLNADQVDGQSANAFALRSDSMRMSAVMKTGDSRYWDIGPNMRFTADCYLIGATVNLDISLLNDSPSRGRYDADTLALPKNTNPGNSIYSFGGIESGHGLVVTHLENPSSRATTGESDFVTLAWTDPTETITAILGAEALEFYKSNQCFLNGTLIRGAA